MNLEHLSSETPTVFERLDDADVRTAGTTYLMYRGRHRHEVANETALTRLATTVFRHADLRARRSSSTPTCSPRARTGCRSQLGLPGVRDQHAGLRRLVPDRARPLRLPAVVAARQRHAFAQERPARPGDVDRRGGPPDRAPDARRRRAGRVPRGSRGDRVLGPLAVPGRGGDRPVPAPSTGFARAAGQAHDARRTPARSPSARRRASAMVYVLDQDREAELLDPRGADAGRARRRRPRDADDRPSGRRGGRPRQARRDVLELRFAPRGGADRPARRAVERGRRPRRARAVRARRADRQRRSTRTRSAASGRRCAAGPRASCSRLPRPGYEFLDWGGAHHVGGGSHGVAARQRLARRADLVRDRPAADSREQWSLRDVVPMIDEHFGVERGLRPVGARARPVFHVKRRSRRRGAVGRGGDVALRQRRG